MAQLTYISSCHIFDTGLREICTYEIVKGQSRQFNYRKVFGLAECPFPLLADS